MVRYGWWDTPEIASSSPGRFAVNLGQVVHIHVPLSPSTIIWYQLRGSDVLRSGR